jgi:hypothetical protein
MGFFCFLKRIGAFFMLTIMLLNESIDGLDPEEELGFETAASCYNL